jgi:hypothetical protein
LNELKKALLKYGYLDSISFKNYSIIVEDKDIAFFPDSLFFVDAGYRKLHDYIFAISSPKHEVRGLLVLDLESYHDIVTSAFAKKFDIAVESNPKEIVIKRQYGMRKILKDEFDPDRYILRVGFDDFPSCPFGHTFKALGYDLKERVYVRLASSILKDPNLQKIYKE